MLYLKIAVTVLVVTQIVRLLQNGISLARQQKMIRAGLKDIDEVTPEDFAIQRKAYRLLVEYFEKEGGNQTIGK